MAGEGWSIRTAAELADQIFDLRGFGESKTTRFSIELDGELIAEAEFTRRLSRSLTVRQANLAVGAGHGPVRSMNPTLA